MYAESSGATLGEIPHRTGLLTDAMPSVVPPACRAARRHGVRLALQRRVRNTLLEEVLQMRVVVKMIGHGSSRDRLDYQKILCNGMHSHMQCLNEAAVGSTNRRERLQTLTQ